MGHSECLQQLQYQCITTAGLCTNKHTLAMLQKLFAKVSLSQPDDDDDDNCRRRTSSSSHGVRRTKKKKFQINPPHFCFPSCSQSYFCCWCFFPWWKKGRKIFGTSSCCCCCYPSSSPPEVGKGRGRGGKDLFSKLCQ